MDQEGPSGRGHKQPTLPSGDVNMMSGGAGVLLAVICMTHQCVDMLCCSATPVPTVKATGL